MLTDTETFNKQNIVTNRIAALHGATSGEQATETVLGWFIAKIAEVLGLGVSDIDPEKPIHAYGNDSLVAMYLKKLAYARVWRRDTSIPTIGQHSDSRDSKGRCTKAHTPFG